MKPLLKFTICIFLSGVSAFISCKKEKIVDSETVLTNNHAPVARAGADQTISLPINSVNLDGSASTDPENNITTYLWTKFPDLPLLIFIPVRVKLRQRILYRVFI